MQIGEAEDHESVYSIEFFCTTCGSNVDDDFIDKWLIRAPFCVVKCSKCKEHIVITFLDLDNEIDGFKIID